MAPLSGRGGGGSDGDGSSDEEGGADPMDEDDDYDGGGGSGKIYLNTPVVVLIAAGSCLVVLCVWPLFGCWEPRSCSTVRGHANLAEKPPRQLRLAALVLVYTRVTSWTCRQPSEVPRPP